jgi:hypothetical protein
MEVSLDLVLSFGFGQKKSTAKIHRTRCDGEEFGCATKHGLENENASRDREAHY